MGSAYPSLDRAQELYYQHLNSEIQPFLEDERLQLKIDTPPKNKGGNAVDKDKDAYIRQLLHLGRQFAIDVDDIFSQLQSTYSVKK